MQRVPGTKMTVKLSVKYEKKKAKVNDFFTKKGCRNEEPD